jgi:16S rRNA processing protein RimM
VTPGDAPDVPAVVYVVVGRIRRAHGIRGELLVESLTGAPEVAFASGQRLFAGTARGEPGTSPPAVHVASAEPFQKGYRIRLAEVADRNAAEQWRGRVLMLPESELPPAPEGDVYLRDLVGFRVERENGDMIGNVTGWYELPQGLLLEVTREPGTVLLPYGDPFVKEVDIKARRLVYTPPEGLLD